MRKTFTFLMLALLSVMTTTEAKVKMPQLFQDGMVLQRGVDIPVWGWAEKGEQVSVSLSNQKGRVLTTATATADEEGRWSLKLPCNKKMKAGEGYMLEIKVQNRQATRWRWRWAMCGCFRVSRTSMSPSSASILGM